MAIFLYQSNLRAYIIAPNYEKPIDTSQDVIDRQVKVFISSIDYKL